MSRGKKMGDIHTNRNKKSVTPQPWELEGNGINSLVF